jgi:hypothetical protein
MKFLLFTILFILAIMPELSTAYVVPAYRDIKPATQVMLEHQAITDPAAAGTTEVLSAHAGPTSAAAVSVTTFVAQPDVPRNLIITPGTSSAAVVGCDVVVSGTDYISGSITETFSIPSTMSTAVTGVQAFKTVTSVAFPANCETDAFGATWSMGYGEALGLKRCLANVGDLAWSTVAGAYEATRPTVVVDADEVSKNTADFNGTMNGANDFQAFFIQNFASACQP